eukprot:scaffold47798_cov23-Tisochrysis_lutea.AAC.1
MHFCTGACSSAPGSVHTGDELDSSSAFQGSSQASEATVLSGPSKASKAKPSCQSDLMPGSMEH